MMVGSRRAAMIHEGCFYGSGIAFGLGWLITRRVELGLVLCVVCWVPSLAIRAINQEWRRFALYSVTLVITAAAAMLAFYLDRGVVIPTIWTPPPHSAT